MNPVRRILFCNYEYPPIGGGGGTCSQWLARELVGRGHRVEVVTARWNNLPRVSMDGGLTVRRIRALRKNPGQSNPREMLSYVASAIPYLLFRGASRPDAIVSFHTIPSGLAAFLPAMIWRVPHITLFRGGDVPGWLPGELDSLHRRSLWLNRLIVNRSAAALANSDGLRELAQRSFPKKEIGVLYNGVDLTEFAPPGEGRAHRSGPVRILFAGRITTQKGLDVLISALSQLVEKDWTLDVAGDGPMLATYRHQATAAGISERIKFHGWLSRETLRQLYDAADFLAFPSRYEGMPNVVLESMSCGLPVIATRIAGSEQLVEDGVTGFLVPVDDVAALRDRLGQLISDSSLRTSMGDLSRRAVESKWSWAARGVELEQVIEAAIARSRGR